MTFRTKRKALKLRAKLGDNLDAEPFIEVAAYNASRVARKQAKLCKIGQRKALRAV